MCPFWKVPLRELRRSVSKQAGPKSVSCFLSSPWIWVADLSRGRCVWEGERRLWSRRRKSVALWGNAPTSTTLLRLATIGVLLWCATLFRKISIYWKGSRQRPCRRWRMLHIFDGWRRADSALVSALSLLWGRRNTGAP